MGAYLSEPVTEKISSDDDGERVRYGASSMQGWRVSQEDAHNCIIDFDKNMSLFAVYDGHGGHEVALYCSQKLPQFIKETEAYKKGDLKTALIDAFLGFDSTIATREVVAVLKEMASAKAVVNDNEEFGSEDEENVINLYEEASMPIEQVMEKYQSNLLNPNIKKLQGDKCPISPMLKAKKCGESSDSSLVQSSSCSVASSSKIDSDETSEESSSSKKDSANDQNSTTGSEVSCSDSTTTSNGEAKHEPSIQENKNNTVQKSEEAKLEEAKEITKIEKDNDISDEDVKKTVANGETTKDNDNNKNVSQANGEINISPKGKGKAIIKKSPKTEISPIVKNLRARNARQLYSKLLEMEEESESEDENDETFEGAPNYSSSEGSGDESSEVDDNEGEANEEDNDDEDEEIYDDDEENEFTRNMTEEPGSDSGCTAVIALLYGNELYVANAGDSRCIVCRNGQAIEMSLDHKPEDAPEMARVIKAGGKVTQDGRVNGGLNLSRAIGDHAYKQNKDLSDREQMITALPDIKTLTINPTEDEFMILACDGIWNFMSSQEVVDFVKQRLVKENGSAKLSQICEDMFQHCLAPHTMGDGTGCDNMTAVIVQFKNAIKKRSASPSIVENTEENSAKRAKTETTTE